MSGIEICHYKIAISDVQRGKVSFLIKQEVEKIPQNRGITVVFLLLLDGGQKRLIWHGICSNFTGSTLKTTPLSTYLVPSII